MCTLDICFVHGIVVSLQTFKIYLKSQDYITLIKLEKYFTYSTVQWQKNVGQLGVIRFYNTLVTRERRQVTVLYLDCVIQEDLHHSGREAKSKAEKERYKHLNAEFQRIARRDKKAFLSDQWKEIEENNRMGKTRDLFKKIRDTKGTFHANMRSIKDRNGMDPTEAEDIKKRWQEQTEKLQKKDLHDPDNHDGVITDLE